MCLIGRDAVVIGDLVVGAEEDRLLLYWEVCPSDFVVVHLVRLYLYSRDVAYVGHYPLLLFPFFG